MGKRERVKAVLRGEIPDATPAGFWFHYDSNFTEKEMIEAHLHLFKETDMDVVKVMQDYRYPIVGQIKSTSDWYKLKMLGVDSAEFKKLESVLKGIVERLNGEAMAFQTMFGALKTTATAFGNELMMTHFKEDPKAVIAGVSVIAEVLAQWAQGYLDAGADGIYYAAQFGEVGRFTFDEWSQLVRASDLKVLEVAKTNKDKYNILHICGEPDYDFDVHIDRYGDYPSDIVNWSVKDTKYSLEKGRDFFKKPILGGLNNKGNILNGTDGEIIAEVNSVIDKFGQKGLMIGADCTIQGENISLDKIRTAVQAAHSYSK